MIIKKIGRALEKGWNYFDIMHKDRRVARIYENGKCKIYYITLISITGAHQEF